MRENLRMIALEVLLECEKGAYSNRLLTAVLEKYAYLEKNRRAFLARLIEGTLERQIELDYRINHFSKVKVKKQKPLIRNLLRMSAYQLKYMDAVPDSAVCNEAVKIARARGFARLSGFVNGVLRTMAREPDPVGLLDESRDPVQAISIRNSIPEWMAAQWIRDYGVETTSAFTASFSCEYPLTIRTNTARISPERLKERLEGEGVLVVPKKELSYAFDISGFDRLDRLETFLDGLFYVQDLSSMYVAEWAAEDLFPGRHPEDEICVLDVCAAPGGKSTHMAQLLGSRGHVEAFDLTDAKVELIRENIRALELTNITARRQDALEKNPGSVEKADVLICDLPCSGLGVMGKKKDIRYRMTPEAQSALAALQRQILSVVWDYVKPGGTLIYSTCTIAKSENEDNVEWFLQQYPGFSRVRQRQLLPGRDSHDGFFLAKLIRSQR